MVEVQQEQKVAGQKLAAKNMVIHQSREELGLHPASKPTGSMKDSTLYFNWRQQGRAVQTSSSFSEDPVFQVVPPVFTKMDVRDEDIGYRNRSKLSARASSDLIVQQQGLI